MELKDATCSFERFKNANAKKIKKRFWVTVQWHETSLFLQTQNTSARGSGFVLWTCLNKISDEVNKEAHLRIQNEQFIARETVDKVQDLFYQKNLKRKNHFCTEKTGINNRSFAKLVWSEIPVVIFLLRNCAVFFRNRPSTPRSFSCLTVFRRHFWRSTKT